MAKNYIIFYDDEKMIFPVKAEYNPYVGDKPAFCAGCPQFFGGATEGKETVTTVLGREVAEESVNNYTLGKGKIALVYEEAVRHPKGYTVAYSFYCTDSWVATGLKWPSAEEWGKLPAASREMCWIATVPIATFDGIGKETTDYDIAALLITAQQAGAPKWAKDQMVSYPNEEFMMSASSSAFAYFVRGWTKK